jgi:hypothetical protein
VAVQVQQIEGDEIEVVLAPGGLSGILCARPVSSLADEPFAEDDGELGLGLEPFARRSFPILGGVDDGTFSLELAGRLGEVTILRRPVQAAAGEDADTVSIHCRLAVGYENRFSMISVA